MKILVAIDGSHCSRAAIDLLARMPFPIDSEVTVLTVIGQDLPFPGPELVDHGEIEELQRILDKRLEEARELVTESAEQLQGSGWTVKTDTRKGDIAHEIITAASELDIDHIVLGSHGRTGAKRFLLGSVSYKVVKYAPCSVLVVKQRSGDQPETGDAASEPGKPRLEVLLAFDGSPPSRLAASSLEQLSRPESIDVTVLTVLTVATTFYRQDILERLSYSWQLYKKQCMAELRDVSASLKLANLHVETKVIDEGGDPSDGIVTTAESQPTDIILLGDTGTSGITRFLMGSVADRVAKYAPCSVWIVRQKAK